MRPILSLVLAAPLLSPSMAIAAPDKPATLPSEVRLSDEEKEKVLEAAAASRREPVRLQADQTAISEDALPPPIHGEVGLSVGTGGYRSAYGTAVVPLEGEGVAIISLGTTDFGSRARYLDPWWR